VDVAGRVGRGPSSIVVSAAVVSRASRVIDTSSAWKQGPVGAFEV
jgi:hypothetical protein